MAHLDAMEVRHTALEVIFDLLMWYGLQAFMDQENSAENTIDRNIEAALESNISDTYTKGGNLSLNDLNSQGANKNVEVKKCHSVENQEIFCHSYWCIKNVRKHY